MLSCQAAGWDLGSREIGVSREGSDTALRIPAKYDTVVRMESTGKQLVGCLCVRAGLGACEGDGG